VMLLAFFYFIIALIINTIVMVGTNGEFLCELQTLVNLRIVNAVQLIVVYVLTILLLFGDVLGNLKMLSRCEIYKYVFKKDPFYFRVQIALFVPYMLYDLAAELYFLIAIQSFPDLIYTVVQTEALNTVNFDILLLIDVVLPLSITIFSVIINLFLEEEVEDSDLMKLLKDPKGRDLFEVFVKKDYTVENFCCWIDIDIFKRLEQEDVTLRSLTDSKKRGGYLSIHAKRICDKYFKGDKSLMEVNVTKKETDLLWRKLKQKKVDSQIFDEVLVSIKLNLLDSYLRFISTAPFKSYQLEQEINTSLIDAGKKKRLGWIAYIRKLFGNFQRNVKRKASFIKRSSTLRLSIIPNESAAATAKIPSTASSVEENITIRNRSVEMLDLASQKRFDMAHAESQKINNNEVADEINVEILNTSSNSNVASTELPLNSDQVLMQQSKRSRVDRNKKNLMLPNNHEVIKKIESSSTITSNLNDSNNIIIPYNAINFQKTPLVQQSKRGRQNQSNKITEI